MYNDAQGRSCLKCGRRGPRPDGAIVVIRQLFEGLDALLVYYPLARRVLSQASVNRTPSKLRSWLVFSARFLQVYCSVADGGKAFLGLPTPQTTKPSDA
eukprot:6182283-Pleurochrysis_carterae.AAC.8